MGAIRMGVDLALKQDYTAIMVVEEVDGAKDEFDSRLYERVPRGTPFQSIIDRVIEIRDNIKAIQDQRDRESGKPESKIKNYGPSEILVDQSGLGDPVVDEMRTRGLEVTGVNLTGGNTVTEDYVKGERHISIPKTALIARLSTLVGVMIAEDGSKHSRLHLDPESLHATAIMEELRNFRMKVTPSANLQFEPFKTGEHDDLIVATGLACWRRWRPPKRSALRVYAPGWSGWQLSHTKTPAPQKQETPNEDLTPGERFRRFKEVLASTETGKQRRDTKNGRKEDRC